MKFVHISFHFEFAETIERILDRHAIETYAHYAMTTGKDCDGKHYGTKVFPGNIDVIQAMVPDGGVAALFEDLEAFKAATGAHRHVRALVLPVERTL